MSRVRDGAALAAGLLFGVGLVLSGMSDPAKVLGFLDVGGAWDPSLALVMVGAIGAATGAFAVASRRERALLGEPMRLPTTRTIDARLVGGSVLFGIGWGLVGLCPGPALVAIGAGHGGAVIFAGAMIAGIAVVEISDRARSRAQRDDA